MSLQLELNTYPMMSMFVFFLIAFSPADDSRASLELVCVCVCFSRLFVLFVYWAESV